MILSIRMREIFLGGKLCIWKKVMKSLADSLRNSMSLYTIGFIIAHLIPAI